MTRFHSRELNGAHLPRGTPSRTGGAWLRWAWLTVNIWIEINALSVTVRCVRILTAAVAVLLVSNIVFRSSGRPFDYFICGFGANFDVQS